MNRLSKGTRKHRSNNDHQKEGDRHHHHQSPHHPEPPRRPHFTRRPTWRHSSICSRKMHQQIHRLGLHLRTHSQRPPTRENTKHTPTPPSHQNLYTSPQTK